MRQTEPPVVRTDKTVVAVLVSDLHLDDKPPIFRSVEKDWLAVQEGYLDQLRFLIGSVGNVPLFVAGDIFNKWNPSPHLINWAIDHLPSCYAVPGQHDLRHHNLADLDRTAYWTLCKSGVITHLKPGIAHPIGQVVAHGFPWGVDVWPCKEKPHTFAVQLAVVHQYVWTKSTSHPGAEEKARLGEFRKKLLGYDACVVGDNHRRFISHKEGQCTVLNNGTFIRRNSDFRDYAPGCGLLFADGTIEVHEFDTSMDKCLDVEKLIEESENPGVADFLDGLTSLGDSGIDFELALKEYVRKQGVPEGVRKILEEVIGAER